MGSRGGGGELLGTSEVHVCPEPSGAGRASRRRCGLGPELGLTTRPGKAHMDRGRTPECPSCGGLLSSCPQ